MTEQILYTVKNVTDFLPNPVAIIQLEHRIPFHEKYTEAAMFPSSNMTIRKELAEVYENVRLIGPSVDGRFYQERQQQEQTWRKAGFDEDKGVEFPFGISPMHAYIEDAILQGAFYEAKSILGNGNWIDLFKNDF